MAIEQTMIDELTSKLEAEKAKLETELGKIADPTDVPGEYETRFEDLGREDGDSETETEQYVDNMAVESTLEDKLRDVTDALDKIKAGTYGKCEKCGVDISIERLTAYPSARICMNHNE